MGFMDKAKKMAEQAQAKLDEAQKQFNAGQGGATSTGPAVEYDQHGRPVAPAAPPEPSGGERAAPPHGDPLAPGGTTPPAAPPAPDPGGSYPPPGAAGEQGWAPPSAGPGEDSWTPPHSAQSASAPTSSPAEAGSQGVPDDRNNPSYEPPTLTSGDPLAG